MKISEYSKPGLALGLALIAVSLLVPPAAMVTFLTGQIAGPTGELNTGATLFKFVLAAVGIFVLLASRLDLWQISTAKPATPADRRVLALLALLLGAATILRLYQLNSGLWLDEILTDVMFARLPFGTILTTYQTENQHFLYSLMAHASFLAFGDSAWSLRLPAVLFGVGSIWACFLLGREVASAREGLLAAALLTFSYQHVWFSQNARGYSGLLFWTILSSYLLLRALRERQAVLWVLYAVSAALGVFTHITMLFVIAGQFLVYAATALARWRQDGTRELRGLFMGFGLTGLLTLQLHALVLPQVLSGVGRETSLVDAWKNPVWTLMELVSGMEISFAGGIIAIIALVVLCAGLVSYARTRPALVALLVIPPVLTAAVVFLLGHHMWPRLFFFALGFGALVAIRGTIIVGELAAKLVRFPFARPAWVGVGLSIGMILIASLSLRFVYGPKQDYQAALDYIKTEQAPGDMIVTASLSTFIYKDYYNTGWSDVKTLGDLNSIRSRAQRTWLIYTFTPVLAADAPDIMESVQHDFKMIKQFDGTVGDGAVYIVRSDGPSKTVGSK